MKSVAGCLALSLFVSASFLVVEANDTECAEYEAFGRKLKRPNTQIGEIVLVDCASCLPSSLFDDAAKHFENEVQYGVVVKKGEFNFPNPDVQGKASLFVVNDHKLPTLLLAPENRWAMVNIAKLKPEGSLGLYHSRVRQEITRGFGLLGGAFQSTYKNTLMTNITSPDQLDAVTNNNLPPDSCSNIRKYLLNYGLAPFKTAYYVEACEEGWAPAPKDEIEKRIAAEVKAEKDKKTQQ